MRLDARTSLNCHEYLHKSHAPSLFDLSKRIKEDDPLISELKRQGLEHERKVFDYLLSLPLNVVEISKFIPAAEAQIQTAELMMDPTVDLILGSYIGFDCEQRLRELKGESMPGDENRVSRPDVLVNMGISNNVHPSWAPVDIKMHSSFDAGNVSNSVIVCEAANPRIENGQKIAGKLNYEDCMQLAHYDTHLRAINFGVQDHVVGIIGRDFQKIAWGFLDKTIKGRGKEAPDYLTLYHQAFLEARNVVERSKERERNHAIPAVTIPIRISSGKFGCKVCEFRDVCKEEMMNYDDGDGHVSLLPRVTKAFINEHLNGIQSISELRLASGLSAQGLKAQIRADSWASGVPQLLDRSNPLAIPHFDTEVDIDLENSQAVLEEVIDESDISDDRVYLYGYSVYQHEGLENIHDLEVKSFENYEKTPDSQLSVLKSMWEELQNLVNNAKEANRTIGIFHYGSHEVTWWRRFARDYAGEPQVPTEDEVEKFVNSYFINLLPIAQRIAFRTSGYSIKDLAPLAGFKWQVSDPGGALSIIKYRIASSDELSEQERIEAKEWLRSYNADDVRATVAVRNYLRRLNV